MENNGKYAAGALSTAMTDEERAKRLLKQFAMLGAAGKEVLVEAAVIIAVEGNGRKSSPLRGSGYGCLDFDGNDVQATARQLAEMAFTAPAAVRFPQAITEAARMISAGIE